MFLQNLGIGELSLILVLVLLLFGPGKLPQVAQSLGNSVRNFKDALQGKASEGATPVQAEGHANILDNAPSLPKTESNTTSTP